MQQLPGLPEEDHIINAKEGLAVTEGDTERTLMCNKVKEVKKAEEEAKCCNGKVADVFSELNSAMESLSKANEDLKNKDIAMKSLEKELEKAKESETRPTEKDASVEKLKDALAKSHERIQQLETELEKTKESESKILDCLAVQTKQLEQTKMLLEESKVEVDNKVRSLPEMEKDSFKKSENSTTKPEGGPVSKEVDLLKNELKQAIEAEENSKKAMDALALALTEVAADANQAKEKLIKAEDELQRFKKESEELEEKLKTMEEKHKILLNEVRKEADLHRNTSNRLRSEAEDTLQAWNGKEKGFVDCIKRADDEKIAALDEKNKLLEALSVAENMNKTAKQDNQKLRDILKQALNEANAAKEAAEIARSENSRLKDLLAEKDDAMIFITRENESLRINEVAAMENIKQLNRLLSEVSSGNYKLEEKELENTIKSENSTDGEQHRERKLSNVFSFNLKDLINYARHKEPPEDHKNIQVRHVENKEDEDEDEDEENPDPLKGSIFDATDSPVAAATTHNHHRRKSWFAGGGDTLSPEEIEHLDGAHIDDIENERNSKKKRALLRRFGDIITRRRGNFHRRELSNGGELQKKESSSTGTGSEGHNEEDVSAEIAFDGDAQKNEHSVAD